MKQERLMVSLVILILFVLVGVNLAWRQHQPHMLSQDDTRVLLPSLWEEYKGRYWESSSGRTVDHQAHDATTSEGQSYTMLRAVWSHDQSTFAKTWEWTKHNLQRTDKLFSWRWGQRSDGSWGVLQEQNGQNSASDADSDIALALLMAGTVWHDTPYRSEATDVIKAIWNQEVIMINGKPFLAADNLEKDAQDKIVINPSYLSPASYRVFAKVDSDHDWQRLATQSYALIQASGKAPLDTTQAAGLPPNWLLVDRHNATFSATKNTNQTTDFGYDAFRSVWRLTLDYEWFQSDEAKKTLEQFSVLSEQWNKNRKLVAVYGHDGKPEVDYSKPAFYGGTLGYFQVMQPKTAEAIYQNQLASLYDPTAKHWRQALDYYDDNWAWFGIALYLHTLPNLTQSGSGA